MEMFTPFFWTAENFSLWDDLGEGEDGFIFYLTRRE
jgi:hypothetical protein